MAELTFQGKSTSVVALVWRSNSDHGLSSAITQVGEKLRRVFYDFYALPVASVNSIIYSKNPSNLEDLDDISSV